MDDPFDVGRDGILVLRLRVRPGAARAGVFGRHGDALKVAVTAPADRGRANAAVLALIAELVGVRPAAVELVSGATSRSKRVAISGRTPEEVRAALRNAAAAGGVAHRRP